MAEIRTETMTVNMGPQHPSTHGVLRLVLELDGETIVSAAPTIGYLHTGIEKTAEQKKFQQVIPLVERMDYLSAQSNAYAYCLSVEKLLGLEMPERVKWIRVLLAELQRINSHLVWLGTHAMEVGAVSVMLYCFRERELLLDINERIAGFRLFPSYIRVGGLREDLPRGFHEVVTQFLDSFPKKLGEYEDLLTKNDIYKKRTQGVGMLSKEDCIGLEPDRSDRPRVGMELRRAQDVSLRRLRHVRVRRARRRRAATSTSAIASALPRCARASRFAARRCREFRRPACSPPTRRPSCRRRRIASIPRWRR